MIYNHVSSKAVIAKVFRDLGIQESDWINFAIEWIGEALEHIGTYSQSIPKAKIAKVNDFKIKIPSDLYILDEIRYSNSNSESIPKRNTFGIILSNMDNGISPSLFEEVPDINPKGYILNGNYINTSFEEGWIAIVYRAFNLDEDGYPMVPDSAEFSEALFWYITTKMLLRGNKHPVIQFGDAEQRWIKYAAQARNAFNMPDKSQYRSFHERWVQMVPQYHRDINQLYDTYKQPRDFTN